jgi:hypothetical protein
MKLASRDYQNEQLPALLSQPTAHCLEGFHISTEPPLRVVPIHQTLSRNSMKSISCDYQNAWRRLPLDQRDAGERSGFSCGKYLLSARFAAAGSAAQISHSGPSQHTERIEPCGPATS